MAENSVKVAVRVRPFNQREKDRKASLVIKMQGAMTFITNPDSAANEEPKKFTFDHSYWSHDSYKVADGGILEADGPNSNYASQQMVFSDLGQGVLKNAFEGYNCSLFAYGQTGSGKSYSMVGYGPNRGIVPITCDTLFKTINGNKDPSKRFEITFSMLEIYNEQVRDLLSKENPKGGLAVRQNPKLGCFYVQGLKQVAVGSYKEIENRMEQGTANRTVASTNMNATSSRAHTVVTITFDQITKNGSSETRKSSVMNLVDLAGSERADSTGATGDRLKEGASINKSLSALGNVISGLADLSMGKKKAVVPYRDSVLTKLLQNALGGNSKTVMIAALSPADINYDETLGTLRYADRAKKIKNKAVVNENPMDKLIRELREENERLRKAMETGNFNIHPQDGVSEGEIKKMRQEMEEQIRAQLMANQELIAQQNQTWEEKLQEARNENMTPTGSKDNRKQNEPHLVNLNEDPMLSGVIYHFLPEGEVMIGRRDQSNEPEICLSGISIMQKHAVITNNRGEVEVRPAGAGAKTKVNGTPLTGPRLLGHKDRVLFGSNHLYVFFNPLKDDANELPEEITWEFAQKEIAQAKGFATGVTAGLSKDQQIAQEQILEILPLVSEVNAISEELNKRRTFEVVLISAAAQEEGYSNKGTNTPGCSIRVIVKMKNLLNGNMWLWARGKFMNRRYLMQDMYQRWLDGDEDVLHIPNEEDPFWEPPEDICIGTANVFLQSLAYALDFDDQLSITDFKGQEEGAIFVHITPCTQGGQLLDEDYFVDKPAELLGKPYHFMVTIKHAEIKKARYAVGVKVRYKVYKEEDFVETDIIEGTLEPHFDHSRIISFPSITQDHLDFFEHGYITLSVYGVQEDSVPDSKLLKMTTRELRQMDNMQKPSINNRNTAFAVDLNSDQSQLKADYLLLQRKFDRLEQKERRMQQLCHEWVNKPARERQFDPFYRAVSAVSFSTGTRLKTTASVLQSVIQGHKFVREKHRRPSNSDTRNETISLYYYGEDEDLLASEAQRNGGLLDSDIITNHAALKDQTEHVLQLKNRSTHSGNHNDLPQTQTNGNGIPQSSPATVTAHGNKREGSKACIVM